MSHNYTKRISCLLLLCLGVWTTVAAQFTISGEIRPRTEFRNGFKTLNTHAQEPAFFTEQRSRLYLSYQQEKVRLHISLQDVRIWGGAEQIYKNDPALTNIYEAWGEYQLSSRWAVRAGRQAVDYDNARFLGDLDWAQQGRIHDALRFLYTDSTGFAFHTGAAYNQSVPFEPGQLSGTYYSGVSNYKTMQYVWLHKDWGTANASLMVFNDGRQTADSSLAFRQTYGLVAEKSLGSMAVGSEIYYQSGKDPAGMSVSAWLLAAKASFPSLLASPVLGVDYVSGSSPEDTGNRAFDPLYGTNHKFYGFMDYFYVGNPHRQGGKTTGLIDVYLQSGWPLGPKSSLLVHLHHFHTPVKVYAAESTEDPLTSVLGGEVDLVYNLNLAPDVNLKVGYSQLFSTESLEVLKGAERRGMNQWAWAMLTFKPVLFQQQ